MSDIANPGDVTQASTLRIVTQTEALRPAGTISNRPVEEEAQANTSSSDTDQATTNQPNQNGEDEGTAIERAESQLEQLLSDTELTRNTRLRIELDEENGQFIYQTLDRETGEIVNQFPPEEIIDLLRTFRSPTGIAVDDQA